MPLRRKGGKKKLSRDLDDIICLMKRTNPEVFPIFMAKDLFKVSPVSMDHLDLTRIVRDLLKVQNQLNALEEKAVTTEKFDQLKQVVDDMKHASLLHNNSSNINIYRRRGVCVQESFLLDSGPIGLNYVPINAPSSSAVTKVNDRLVHEKRSSLDKIDFVSFLRNEKDATVVQRVEAATKVSKGGSESCNRVTSEPASQASASGKMDQGERVAATAASTVVSDKPAYVPADCVRARRQFTSPSLPSSFGAVSCLANSSELEQLFVPESNAESKQLETDVNTDSGWQVVQRKTPRQYRLISHKGRAATEPTGKCKATVVKMPLFISNVSVDTSEDDIISYIQLKTNETVSLKKINMKSVRNYSA